MEEKSVPPPSLIINRAGHNGLWLGAYLSALAVGSGLSATVPLLSLRGIRFPQPFRRPVGRRHSKLSPRQPLSGSDCLHLPTLHRSRIH